MLVEVLALSVVLTRSPEMCGVGKSVFYLDSSSDFRTLTTVASGHYETLSSRGLEDALARDLALVKEVRHVSIERADNNLLVWVVLDNPVKEVRERVFRKELELIEGFPEVDFDFNVIAAVGRDPQPFASSAKLVYSREGDEGAN